MDTNSKPCGNGKCGKPVDFPKAAFCNACWKSLPWDMKRSWREMHSERILVKMRRWLEERGGDTAGSP